MTITDEQRAALEQHSGGPVYVADPLKNATYVIIAAETYEKMRAQVDADGFDVRETYSAQERALGLAGWDDPAMDAYNDYDSNQQQL